MRRLLPVAAGWLLSAALPAAAAEFVVEARDDGLRNFFEPAELTIQAGDTVRWVNKGSRAHNVDADDGSFRCSDGCEADGASGDPVVGEWEFTQTFDDPGELLYHCDLHGGPDRVGMSGLITVEPKDDGEGIPFNYGLTGSWFNPATDGQGFNIEVVVRDGEPAQVVVYWFTFSETGSMAAGKQVVDDQRWFIAVGDVPAQGEPAMLEVFLSTGGRFDSPEGTVEQPSVGTAMLEFSSCTEGTLTYDVNLSNADEQQVSGEIPIQRLTPDVVCEDLLAEG